ncbi:MAG: TetR/AcrR family transcriptional regulator [Bacteriovorax sp.]|jgi:AcrR family transcriptional regulator|nr:TetR/AcrR family transcriptional regulator [Bacteriovorax sp.]
MPLKENKKACLFFTRKDSLLENTKNQLLDAARKHFCEKGFAGSSIRDICDETGANVSAIKYHFGGKEGLYRECFKTFGETRLHSASKILTHANSIDELKLRLKLFCEDFLNEGLANMHTTKMICREIENENPLIDDIFQETFLKVYSTLVDVFEDAKKKSLIRSDIDSMTITSLFFHSLTTSLRLDHVGERYFKKTLKDPKYAELYINNMISIFFDGLKIQE